MSIDLGHIAVSPEVRVRDDWGRFVSEVEAAALVSVAEIAKDIADMGAIFAPKKTGELAGSGKPVVRGTVADAVFDADHAAAQEEGAGAHVIESHEGPFGVLANKEEGFFSSHAVMHPGNPATHFLRKAGQLIATTTAKVSIRRNFPGLS